MSLNKQLEDYKTATGTLGFFAALFLIVIIILLTVPILCLAAFAGSINESGTIGPTTGTTGSSALLANEQIKKHFKDLGMFHKIT